ncbi:diguanylate cyclase (GGDEF) domain-containing protein [Nitrosomonas cryotolerans]|uniref:diguanylate cyclase n=1 Tax=Nitrosomonas cryotolerans ATCC 49181 TaxID=1131553 RepID=A0A1N6JD35_9PROT|nr:diguanylate cyclase [Nitrosomonas cryotolerans]SFP49244.1 diguanylate cyclase (GGDEF) domain-containing protein [Nitrosomonas cryotolerans]SIO42195.1 diguanylate cyclase (GGDEF) domain-containing protein [Nitrosomonas cryotolerans ATCC 49181]
MSKERRIIAYRKAAEAMCRGEFTQDIPVTGNDEISHLGKSLRKLSTHLQQQYHKNQLLSKITLESNLNLCISDVLNHIYESFNKFIPYDRMSLALLENEGNTLKLHWVRADYQTLKLCTGYTIPMSDNNLKEIIDTEKSFIINDLESYLESHPESDSARVLFEEEIRSSLACPLIATGKPIGFIFLSSRKSNTYKNLHQELFLQIASQLAVIVEKSKLYKKAKINKQLIEHKKELEQRVTHDALTGLLNRTAIFDIFHKQIARAKRGGFSIAVIMIDIDHFKEVNDSYGHLTGDVVLCEIADRLLGSARSHEHLGRFGGEEFLAILSPCNKDGALKAAERFRTAIACKEVYAENEFIPVTISLGISVSTELDTLDKNILLRKADEALYMAKNNGRNCVEIAMDSKNK